MRLAEIDGKALLRRHGLAVPRGVLLQGYLPAEAKQWTGHVLKAQVLAGGRGKRGLVRRLAGLEALAETRQAIASALDHAGAPLLLEEALPIAREIYVAVRIDGTRQTLELLVAPQGGQEVEQAARTWSFWKSIRSCSRRTGISSPAMPRSFATTARSSGTTGKNFQPAACWRSAA